MSRDLRFPSVVGRVPEGNQGEAEVRYVTVAEEDVRIHNLRSVIHGQSVAAVHPGTYAQLRVKGELVMSDTQMEQRTNRELLYHARGDVLIGGLGLGMVLPPLLEAEEVSSVTVLEISRDVVTLVAPHYRHPKLAVIWDDVFTWRPIDPQRRFDTIYLDIWPDRSVDNLPEIAKLHNRYKTWKRSGGWMSSWQVAHLRALRAAGRWR